MPTINQTSKKIMNLIWFIVFILISKGSSSDMNYNPAEMIRGTQVMIWFKGHKDFEPDCIGTIYSKKHVITTATCFVMDDVEGTLVDFMNVRVGKDLSHFTNQKNRFWEISYQYKKLKYVYFHPLFSVIQKRHPDLAVLVLASDFKFDNPFIFPIPTGPNVLFMDQPRINPSDDSSIHLEPDSNSIISVKSQYDPFLNCYTMIIIALGAKEEYQYKENRLNDLLPDDECKHLLRSFNRSGNLYHDRQVVCAKTNNNGIIKVSIC